MNTERPSDTPSEDGKWWFNMRTRQVEFGLVSNAIDRVGPFETSEEAARAPEILAERARAWRDDEEAED